MNRAWRLVATSISFAAFGVGGLIASVTVFPLIALVSRDAGSRTRRARAFVGMSFRSFFWLMAVLRVGRFEIEPGARAKLAAEKGKIVVANHPTLIDVILLLGFIDQANCVVKASLWRNPCLSWAVRAAAYIPNGDLETLLADCERILRDGQTLIIFPEATRTVPGRPIRLQRGAASIALRANAALRVVHFRCDPSTLSKAEPWYRIPETQPCYSMKLGGSLHARDFMQPGEHYGVAARRLTSALQGELSKDVFADRSAGVGAQAAAD